MNPQARIEDIVVQEVFDELVIYDLKRDKIHNLNPTAAFIWRHCNGQRAPAELAELFQQAFAIPQAQPLVWLTLERLERAHLLEGKLTRSNGHRTLTRREVFKMVGVSIVLLPVVTSMAAPVAAQATTIFRRWFSFSITGPLACNNQCRTPAHCQALCDSKGPAGCNQPGATKISCLINDTSTCNCCCSCTSGPSTC